ncbi:pilus assembly protein PilM [Xenorhabdus stockiae]|uniref:pilus assembly protein PilM n=1 Tax=Xenorhabdus stockiae TaxID=351614 RepID=UPI004062D68A
MYPAKWYIGLDIHNHYIRALAATKRRHGWQFRHCWHYSLFNETPSFSETPLLNKVPNTPISGGWLQYPEKLRKILTQWRQILPNKVKLRLALPVQQTLQKQIPLPQHISLQEPELGWFVRANAEKQFPTTDLALDYRVLGQQICISATRQKDLNFWLSLLAEVGLSPDAIDIAPCALRYVAEFAGIPGNSWLVHQRKTDWLWLAPASLPFSYGLVSTQSHASLTQVINQLPITPDGENYPIYYSDEQPTSLTPIKQQAAPAGSVQVWHLLSAFCHYQPPIPENIGAFMIAAGLALRPDDQ